MLNFLSHNPHRATMQIDVGKKTYTLKLDFERLVALEAFLGVSLLTLAQKVSQKEATFYELTAILYAGLSGRDKARMSFEVFGQHLLAKGFAASLKEAAHFLTYALKGAPQDFCLNGLLHWGLGLFSLNSSFFWRLSLPEFFAFFPAQASVEGMGRKELDAMMQQFPDSK